MRVVASLLACLLVAGMVSALDKAEHCKCRNKAGRRIIGGKVTSPTDYPWQVSISLKEQLPKEERQSVKSYDKIEAHGKYNRWLLASSRQTINRVNKATFFLF